MTSSATNHIYSSIFPANILAYTSTRPVDFAYPPQSGQMSAEQKETLYVEAQVIHAVCNIRQVHGTTAVLGKKNTSGAIAEADAIVTNEHDLPIAIRTADCLPVFLYDPHERVIALVHAGWRGTKEGIVAKTVNFMREHFFTKTSTLKAALGPAIRRCHYEVGEEFRCHFKRNLVEEGGKLFFDLVKENKDQLHETGVLARNIFDAERCTHCDPNYFSHRREGAKAGRMISVMMIKTED